MPTDAEHPAGPESWGFVCPNCRYDTRELAADNCPECGTTLSEARVMLDCRQRIGSPIGRMTVTILTTLTGLAFGFVATALLMGVHRTGFRENAERLWAIAILVVCAIGGAIPCINWIRRAQRRRLLHPGYTLFLLLVMFYLAAQH
ncbi:MAG: hypothetical protein IPJ41_03460 [Phycisphaerales bacterium]|nr:hypothetical protein [Phycisphaerales bacterium]